jgi:hypothetical protein
MKRHGFMLIAMYLSGGGALIGVFAAVFSHAYEPLVGSLIMGALTIPMGAALDEAWDE